MLYGTAGHIVASVPDKVAFMPSRIFRLRANQLAEEPESAVMMQLSGNFGESSRKTRCGLMGSASFMALASTTFHQSLTFFSISSRQLRSVFLLMSGISACNVAAVSPTKFTSIG